LRVSLPSCFTASWIPSAPLVTDSSPVKNHPAPNPSSLPMKEAEHSRWNRKPAALPVIGYEPLFRSPPSR